MVITYKTRFDALPQHDTYADNGCHVQPKCLSCPLPVCVEDMPAKEQQRRTRDKDIRRMRRQGTGVPKIAKKHSISERTVSRVSKGRNQ